MRRRGLALLLHLVVLLGFVSSTLGSAWASSITTPGRPASAVVTLAAAENPNSIAFEAWLRAPSDLHSSFNPSSPDNWLGGMGNWSIGADWSAGEPGGNSDVFINTGNDNVTLDVNASINSLTLGGTTGTSMLTNSGSTSLTIAGALTINQSGTLIWDDGSVSAGGIATNSGTINLHTSLVQGANVINSGNINLMGSFVSATGTLTNSGYIMGLDNFSGVSGTTVVNSGSILSYSVMSSGDFINQTRGLVNAQYLNVNGDLTNLGTVQGLARNSNLTVQGELINGGNFDGSYAYATVGSLQNNSGGRITVGYSLIANGNASNAGIISVPNFMVGFQTFQVNGTLTNAGLLSLDGYVDQQISASANNIVNSGTIDVEHQAGLTTVNLTNSGTITTGAQNGGNEVSVFGMLTNDAVGVLSLGGMGDLGYVGSIDNAGSVSVANGASLNVTGGANSLINSGTIDVENGGVFRAATASNTGAIMMGMQHGGNYLYVSGMFTNDAGGNLSVGGMGDVASIGFINNAGNVSVANGATLDITGGSHATASAFPGFINSRTVLIASGGTLSTALTYSQTSGQTTVDGTLHIAGNAIANFSGGAVYGNGGTIQANTISNAAFNIGDMPMTVGTMAIMGNYTQGGNGSLYVDIASLTQYDQLSVSGRASLNGLLNVDLLNGYVPQIGNMFDIMNFSSRSGTFSMVLGLPINNQEHFVLEYNADNLTLDVVSGPDLEANTGHWSGSGDVYYEPYVSQVSQDTSLGDFEGSAPSASVPEPGSILLLGSGILSIAALRRRKTM